MARRVNFFGTPCPKSRLATLDEVSKSMWPFLCAVSSVVEHYLDTVGVTGSNPVSRTIPLPLVFRCEFPS